MDENLIGYLLNALEPAAKSQTESYLRSNPEAQRRLETLKLALAPLAMDNEPIEPPAGLRLRTLALVAKARTELPIPISSPKAPPVRHAPVRTWWRRADMLVAASILVLVAGLVPPGITYLHRQRNIANCQNNLREFYTPLMSYSDRHGGYLPAVEDKPPHDFAGIFVPLLSREGAHLNVRCAASNLPQPMRISLEELNAEWAARPEQFERDIRQLAGCYAYTLGYRNEAGIHSAIRFEPSEPNNRWIAILSDRPPFEQQFGLIITSGNSRNHEGRGQNVLFLDGHYRFCTTTNVGAGGDDIYVNQNQTVEAGLNKLDTVLGASGFRPYPQRAHDPADREP